MEDFRTKFPEVETRIPQSMDDRLEHVAGCAGSGVTARRTEPGNRAHAFRMTLVVQRQQTSSNYNPLKS